MHKPPCHFLLQKDVYPLLSSSRICFRLKWTVQCKTVSLKSCLCHSLLLKTSNQLCDAIVRLFLSHRRIFQKVKVKEQHKLLMHLAKGSCPILSASLKRDNVPPQIMTSPLVMVHCTYIVLHGGGLKINSYNLNLISTS